MRNLTLTAFQIQDLIVARARTVLGFKKLVLTPMEIYQPEDLPALAVFLVGEAMESDGNAGEPHFLHTVTIGIQAIVVSSDAEDQRAKIMAALGQIDTAILTDPPTLMPIEEIKRIRRSFKYERLSETPIAQLSSEIELTFRSSWAPLVPDDYLIFHAQTRFPIGGDTNSVDQVVVQWDIPPN